MPAQLHHHKCLHHTLELYVELDDRCVLLTKQSEPIIGDDLVVVGDGEGRIRERYVDCPKSWQKRAMVSSIRNTGMAKATYV